jgi:hypothetical protein
LYATVEGVVEVELSGNLAVSRAHDKRGITFTNCEPWRVRELRRLTNIAKLLAFNARGYVEGMRIQLYNYPRYNAWFGCPTPQNMRNVRITLQRIARLGTNRFRDFYYDCLTPCSRDDITSQIGAYTPQSIILLLIDLLSSCQREHRGHSPLP